MRSSSHLPRARRSFTWAASGEHTAGNIAEVICVEFGVTRQAVSRQLGVLRRNKWVRSERDENFRVVSLHPDALGRLTHEVARLKYLWARRIGNREHHEPQLHHAIPFGSRSIKADRIASRAATRKDDAWWRD